MNKIIGISIIDSNGEIWKAGMPHRHIDLLITMKNYYTTYQFPLAKSTFQGFYIDDDNMTVLSREDAYLLAIENGQFKDDGRQLKYLYSEDLW